MKSKELKEDKRLEELISEEQEYVGELGYRFHNENDKHLHTLNGKPLLGTSTVVGVLAKPLTWWASGLACEKFGWINKGNAKKGWTPKEERLKRAGSKFEEIKNLSHEEYLNLLDEAYKAHSVKLDTSATAGTDLHAELERYVKNTIEGKVETYDEKILPFITWATENVEKFLWSEAHCYSERLWVGGISDCGALLKNGKTVIIDFKSSKEAYQSHFIQIAGYDIQISENGLLGNQGTKKDKIKKIDGYAVVPFGSTEFTVDFRWNTDELKKGFESALILYKLVN